MNHPTFADMDPNAESNVKTVWPGAHMIIHVNGGWYKRWHIKAGLGLADLGSSTDSEALAWANAWYHIKETAKMGWSPPLATREAKARLGLLREGE